MPLVLISRFFAIRRLASSAELAKSRCICVDWLSVTSAGLSAFYTQTETGSIFLTTLTSVQSNLVKGRIALQTHSCNSLPIL